MSTTIPAEIAAEINTRLDAALVGQPAAARQRDSLFAQLAAGYVESGEIPAFSITPAVTAEEQAALDAEPATVSETPVSEPSDEA